MTFIANLPTVDPQSVRDGAALWDKGFKNYLINGDFAINQRVFAGGALAAGVYGFDRWKAGTGGCNVSLVSGVLTHTSGPLVQVIEAPGLAGQNIVVSVEDLAGGSLAVNVDGVIGSIAPSSGRNGVVLAVPAGSTGNVTLTLTPASGAVTYKRVQIELGSVATAFEFRPPATELGLCGNYCRRLHSGAAFGRDGVYAVISLVFPAMRAVPALTTTAAITLTNTLTDYAQTSYPGTAGAYLSSTGGHVLIGPFSGLTANAPYSVHGAAGGSIVLDAEL